ncbi:MAG: N-6 DNA methylase [Candidatus Omnitrophica bacterium]|nr:N-6 DNA methylase [Candidatus Omnitrophota bacterium]
MSLESTTTIGDVNRVNQSIEEEVGTLNSVLVEADSLIDVRNRYIKNFFIDSLRKGYSYESMIDHFEHSLEKFERKDMGQYYTPKTIVEYIISQLDIQEDSKILDPSCGCGSFLLTLFDKFKERYSSEFVRNIYGVDINEDAANMTRLCIYMKADFDRRYIPFIKQNIKSGNSIVSNPALNKNAFSWKNEYPDVMQRGGFDFIIGNPPYVTLRNLKDFDSSESIYRQIVEGPVNAATLMIGRSLELLKKQGVLAFLLPKSILYVDSYQKLRSYLSHNTDILQIYDLGSKFKDVRGEQFILFVRKKLSIANSYVRICVFADKNKTMVQQPCMTLSHKKLIHMPRFYTYELQEHYNLIANLSDAGIELKNLVDDKIFRGLPIGGNRAEQENDIGYEKIIRGRDIAKFRLKNLPFMKKELLEKQSKVKTNELKQKKVVLQNIFSSEAGVIAAYDPHKLLNLDTVTNIVVKDDDEGKYFLALLNSKLINFYIMYALFNRSKLTMHLDKSYIGSIPVIPNPNQASLNRLIRIIDSLDEINDKETQKENNKEIDKIVYDIYDLSNQEIKLIEDAVNKMLSPRSLW